MALNRSLNDPISLEVIRHQLLSVVDDMNITMRRTTRSIVAKETNDFSAALLDADGSPVILAMPYGLRVFAHASKFVISKFKERMAPGDVYITNDPYGGTSHLPDILAMAPIFVGKRLVAFAATYQHHTDMGGRFPGGFGTESKEVYEEGLRLPIVRFYQGGRPDESVHDIIGANVRAPDDVLGDLEANAAACRRGVIGLLELFAEHGLEQIISAWMYFISSTEAHLRNIIRELPDGRYSVSGAVDDGSGTRFALGLTSVIEGDSLTVDLTGSAEQQPGAWNVPPGMAVEAVLNTFFGLLTDVSMVVNAGLLGPIRLIAPLGTVVNPAFPAAVASRGQAVFVLTDLMLESLALAQPGRFPASGDGGNPILVFSAGDRGPSASMLVDIWCGGWGARPTSDGVDGVSMMAMNGFRNSSAELMELSGLLAVDGFGFVTDSGGCGEYRGCLSIYRRFRILQPGRVMLRTPRSNIPGDGRAGGQGGRAFSARLVRDGVTTKLPSQSVIDLEVEPGDVIEHIVSGGGGYGRATAREPAAVLRDVLNGNVSLDSARRDYGVVIDPTDLMVDNAATELLRRAAADR